MNDFAQELKAARSAAGITQDGMDERMQIPKRTIQDWEGGKRTPPSYVQRFVLNELKAIADARTAENSDGLPTEI